MTPIQKLTFEQACEITGRDPLTILPYPNPQSIDDEAYNSLKRLEIFTEAYNMVDGKKWIPDYGNNNEAKWFAWLEWDEAARAFRFYLAYDGCTNAHSATGSRHVSRTSEIARHLAMEHLDEWNKWHKKE